jgi:hypothetical protein
MPLLIGPLAGRAILLVARRNQALQVGTLVVMVLVEAVAATAVVLEEVAVAVVVAAVFVVPLAAVVPSVVVHLVVARSNNVELNLGPVAITPPPVTAVGSTSF